MRNIRILPAAGVLAVAAAVAGCASSDPYSYPVSTATPAYPHMVMPGTTYSSSPAYVAPAGVEFGRVTHVALVDSGTRASGNSPAGALIGGLVGGVVGNQIGSGSGRAVATILGAAAGAAVGNRVANGPNYNVSGPVYRVWVQTDSGYQRTFDVSTTADLRPGDRVRIENGVIYMG